MVSLCWLPSPGVTEGTGGWVLADKVLFHNHVVDMGRIWRWLLVVFLGAV